jgi:hypothetical protein
MCRSPARRITIPAPGLLARGNGAISEETAIRERDAVQDTDLQRVPKVGPSPSFRPFQEQPARFSTSNMRFRGPHPRSSRLSIRKPTMMPETNRNIAAVMPAVNCEIQDGQAAHPVQVHVSDERLHRGHQWNRHGQVVQEFSGFRRSTGREGSE